MSDEFPRPSGDAITDRKRKRAAEAKAESSFAAPTLLGIVEKYSEIIYAAPLQHPDHIHACVKAACGKTWDAATEYAAQTVERCGMSYAAGDCSILAENATGSISDAVRRGKMP
jgi:hypothetical protein